MASYRFCRTDDLKLLVEAHNACYQPYVADVAPLTVDDLKRSAREFQFWTSSCMVAFEGREPIAVLLACKREKEGETRIWRLGVREDERRRGHARHLLTSLSAKLAILGPPRLVAELPRAEAAANAFFDACGWNPEVEYRDLVLREPGSAPSELAMPMTVDELAANDVLASTADDPWERRPQTLLARSSMLQGLAIASDSRIEAWLLFRTDGGVATVTALGAADPGRWELWLGPLLGQLATSHREIRLERIHDGALSFDLLRSHGFEQAEATVRYAAIAQGA